MFAVFVRILTYMYRKIMKITCIFTTILVTSSSFASLSSFISFSSFFICVHLLKQGLKQVASENNLIQWLEEPRSERLTIECRAHKPLLASFFRKRSILLISASFLKKCTIGFFKFLHISLVFNKPTSFFVEYCAPSKKRQRCLRPMLCGHVN